MNNINIKKNRDEIEKEFIECMKIVGVKARIVFHENPFHKDVWYWGFEGEEEVKALRLLYLFTRLI